MSSESTLIDISDDTGTSFIHIFLYKKNLVSKYCEVGFFLVRLGFLFFFFPKKLALLIFPISILAISRAGLFINPKKRIMSGEGGSDGNNKCTANNEPIKSYKQYKNRTWYQKVILP